MIRAATLPPTSAEAIMLIRQMENRHTRLPAFADSRKGNRHCLCARLFAHAIARLYRRGLRPVGDLAGGKRHAEIERRSRTGDGNRRSDRLEKTRGATLRRERGCRHECRCREPSGQAGQVDTSETEHEIKTRKQQTKTSVFRASGRRVNRFEQRRQDRGHIR
jgi:hypothetical protein